MIGLETEPLLSDNCIQSMRLPAFASLRPHFKTSCCALIDRIAARSAAGQLCRNELHNLVGATAMQGTPQLTRQVSHYIDQPSPNTPLSAEEVTALRGALARTMHEMERL